MNTQHTLHRMLYLFVVLALVLATFFSVNSQAVTTANNSTDLLLDINSGSTTTEFTAFKKMSENLLFFAAKDNRFGYEPWVTDGSASGTHMLLDIFPGSQGSMNPLIPDFPYPFDLQMLGSELFFFAQDANGYGMWKTGGTTETTVKVLETYPTRMQPLGNLMYFNYGGFFSATNGTPGNVTTIGAFGMGKGLVTAPIVFKGKFYAFTKDVDVNTNLALVELWSCGTTACDTEPIKSWTDVPDALLQTKEVFAPYPTKDLFFFNGYSVETGSEIWQSNGTIEGTEMVGEVIPGSDYIRINISAATDDTFFFIGGTDLLDDTTVNLYATRGKAAGGIQQLSSQVAIAVLEVRGKHVYFIDNEVPHSVSWWARTDGTPEGTVKFKPAAETYRSGLYIEELKNAVFFAASPSDILNLELYVMPGQASETRLFAEIRPGSMGSNPKNLYRVNDKLIFTANDGTHGQELWVANWNWIAVFLPMILK